MWNLVAGISTNRVVYKGMLTAGQIQTDMNAPVVNGTGAAVDSVTSYFGMRKVGLMRDAQGRIERAPESHRIYVDVLLRTVGISATVTVLCLLALSDTGKPSYDHANAQALYRL